MKKNKKQTEKKQANYGKYIRWFWLLFAAGVFAVGAIFLLASWGVFGKLPDETALENPEKNLATAIISSDGVTIGKFYKENRTPVTYGELPPHLIEALISTEDIRFYNHSGIDARGTLRAILTMGSKGGASTITQQLAKLYFTDNVSKNTLQRVIQKVKEWIIAVRLERRYTKEEILTMYFNEYDFVNQAVGIESAAHIYFDKSPSDLSVEESAVLVGMFVNSSLYNPVRNPAGVTNRRNVVLGQMHKYKFIDKIQRDSLMAKPLDIRFTPQGHDEGIATYFREYVREFTNKWIRENPKSDGSYYDMYSDGLKIYVTLDSQMQEHAERAIDEHMSNLQKQFDLQNKNNATAPFRGITKEQTNGIINASMRRSDRWREMREKGMSEKEIVDSFHKETRMRIFSWGGDIDTIMKPIDSIRYYKSFLQASMMSMTPQTGEVKAWVGGIDYKHFKYDMVRKGKRQTGSVFKPFVYATAIDQMHLSPCDTFPNTLYTIEAGKYGLLKPWTPKNAGDKYGGMLTLKEALAQSVNTISARLMDRVGPVPVLELIEKMGVDTHGMPESPSLGLGVTDISVYEMVGAYSVFANKGVYVKPTLIQRIEDKNGTILYQNTPETRDVMSAETAYVTVKLMEGVTMNGSGTRLRHKWAVNAPVYKNVITGYPYGFENPIAGKTGTTQNQSDGWFIGMVPDLVTGVWVGGEDRATRFSNLTYGQGATMALPIWGLYMKKCYADEALHISDGDFEAPDVLTIETDCSRYKAKDAIDDKLDWEDELDF